MIDDIAIGAPLSRNLGSPTAPGEATEAELDKLIERRSRQKDPEQEEKSQSLQRTGTPRSLKDIIKAKPRRTPWKRLTERPPR